MPNVEKSFFIYSAVFSSLAASSTSSKNISIQADSAFIIQKLAVMADVAAAAQTASSRVLPLVTLKLTDSGSGRDLMDQAVPIPSIFGSGDLPFILPTPKTLQPRSQLTVEVSNYSAATAYNLRLAFIGYKLFQYGN